MSIIHMNSADTLAGLASIKAHATNIEDQLHTLQGHYDTMADENDGAGVHSAVEFHEQVHKSAMDIHDLVMAIQNAGMQGHSDWHEADSAAAAAMG